MLKLSGVTKEYRVGEQVIYALKGVDLEFGDRGFSAVLGPSGCGKTTLMNIIGGLDKYSDGDEIINGESTKGYKEADWNHYRNHRIGFVFQSYNLIPHMTVLKNVELALTLSGIEPKERRERAEEALARVGLSDQAAKRPNQISGGQMQRVAIARAIVNSPEILLADEPTGAIDSDTSLQVMEILKEISKDCLVVLVTHNKELAEGYADRIISMKDGLILEERGSAGSAARKERQEEAEVIQSEQEGAAADGGKPKKPASVKTSMSFLTAIRLSFTNLIDKKGRSVITVFAGSIGIICIMLILAMNSGFSNYIDDYETSSLTKYPIAITSSSSSIMEMMQDAIGGDGFDPSAIDLNDMLDLFKTDEGIRAKYTDEQIIYMEKVILGITSGDIGFEERPDMNFKIDNDISKFTADMAENFDSAWGTVRVDYGLNLNVYSKSETGKYTRLNPLFDQIMSTLGGLMMGGLDEKTQNGIRTMLDSLKTWTMMVDDRDIILSQYDVLAGHLPDYTTEEGMREIVIVVDEYNQIDDYTLLFLGKISLFEFVAAMFSGEEDFLKGEYSFSEFLNQEFTIMASSDYYVYDEGTGLYEYADNKTNIDDRGITLKISGVVRLKEGLSAGCIAGVMGYTQSLTEHVITRTANSDIVTAQRAEYAAYLEKVSALAAIQQKMAADDFDPATLTPAETLLLAQAETLGIKSVVTGENIPSADYEQFLNNLSVKDLSKPNSIYIYPSSLENKDKIVAYLNDFNARINADGELSNTMVDYTVTYTDDLSQITGQMTSMIDTITYILIAVAIISVIVTMLLVGIVLYISVQDRTKEIGVLRSLGASKQNVTSVFIAETFLIGLVSGITGVLLGLVCVFPANAIVFKLMGIQNLLQPSWWQGLGLVAFSFVITVISGLIPAAAAAKKDPVLALRTE